jgi:flavin reductase (DIM6/NTAB) family NADH-FMN oxidoreductase RutF
MAEIDSKLFRTVLGHFPTGVTIVTGLDGDEPAGFTIGSFTSVSLDPPLVGFLPMVTSETWKTMSPAGRFCVNVLRDAQVEMCWRFAKSAVRDDRFDGVNWVHSPTGCPILEGSIAWIDCTIAEQYEMGDHYFVLGRVVALAAPEYATGEEPDPLIFYRGQIGGFRLAES